MDAMKIYHIPISKFQKNAEFIRKIIKIRHGTRIANVLNPAGFETGREHWRTN
jgi:hypothetical protein